LKNLLIKIKSLYIFKKHLNIKNEFILIFYIEDEFQPLRKLGHGSFGEVYLVRERNTGKLFAMKTLSKKNNLEDSWLRYVQTERDVLATSQNPFIVGLRYAF
jgi:serine/threonine protein kinase